MTMRKSLPHAGAARTWRCVVDMQNEFVLDRRELKVTASTWSYTSVSVSCARVTESP